MMSDAGERADSGRLGRGADVSWRSVELASVDSTQAEAARRAAAGERGPLWIRADVQTDGRGRLGRSWSSPAGNFAATLLFAPAAPVAVLHQLSLVAGTAAIEALSDVTDGAAAAAAGGLRLKWPNDLMLGAGKLGGILVESTSFGAETIAMIGIGINIAEAPPVAGRAVARLSDITGVPPSASGLLVALAQRMNHWLGRWQGGQGFAAVREAWLQSGTRPGEQMTVTVGAVRHEGAFAGLDHDGALLLSERTGGRRRITFGDVTLVPQGA